MRPLSTITLAIAGLLSAPMALWSVGLSRHWMLELHLIALGIILRLLVAAASLAGKIRDVLWVGVFGGAMGSLFSQVLLHRMSARSGIAAVFDYGSLGVHLYQANASHRWFPFALSLVDTAFYSLLAVIAFYSTRRLIASEIPGRRR